MKRIPLALLIAWLLLALAPASSQGAIWCRAFDFLTGQQGWTLSYSGEYGRYTTNAGFSVSSYGSTTAPYAQTASIRIHRDFSGTIRQIYIYAAQPDLTNVFVDYNSLISDGDAFDDDVFTVGAASPSVIAFEPTAVSGRLGLELVKLNQPMPMTSVITGIALTGEGTNPFGSDNCASSIGNGGTGGDVDQLFEASIDGPFAELFAGFSSATTTLNGLPNNLAAPNGLPMLPAANFQPLFAYAKWLLSPAAADEIAGPFAPVLQHLGLIVALNFALVVVYITVWLMIYVARFVLWIAKWLLTLMNTVLSALGSAANAVISGAKALLSAFAR